MYRRSALAFIITLVLISISACHEQASPEKTAVAGWGEQVDRRFGEFYALLGGKHVLGVPISPKFNHKGLEYQYTAAALMVFDPLAPESQRYQLAPIGVELGLSEPYASLQADDQGQIYPAFKELYDQLGRARFVGRPLTAVRYNPELDRVEQHFENLGFYQLEADERDQVRLLHYGAWMCAQSCDYQSPQASAVILPSVVETPFLQAISRLDLAFTGDPLSEPYTAPDGQLEQIYENVVVVAAPTRPGGIALRPISAMLGIPVQLEGDYEIPKFFLEYLNQNSGLELSGPPGTAYQRQSDEVYRQCFRNLCLDHFPNKRQGLQIRLSPLGYQYKNRYYQGEFANPAPDSLQTVTLKVWEGYPIVTPGDPQSITVAVYVGRQPLAHVQPVLTLTFPAGEKEAFTFEPTREDGRSFLDVDTTGVPHGTNVPYRVCVNHLADEQICVEDEFLVWGSP
jgi:hypothetical protein